MLWHCGVGELLRVPSTARRSDQSILKEIIPEYLLEVLADLEAPILWPPDVKNWPIGKDLDAGKGWRQEQKETTEDDIVGWHHQLQGHEFEQAPGAGDGQGSLVRCSPWGHKELDTTEPLNWIKCNLLREAREKSIPLIWFPSHELLEQAEPN